jgi:hypothetical protein
MGKGKVIKDVKSNITDNQSAKMTTSKGTIQGYNGVATVDKKHQVIIDAQAFGEGQEHHTLKPVLDRVKSKYKRLGISDDIFSEGTIVTADTGFANEANMKYLHEDNINAYIPDNKFRSRDPKIINQKPKKDRVVEVIPASEFEFYPINLTCVCPAGEKISHIGNRVDQAGVSKAFFNGRLLQCRNWI